MLVRALILALALLAITPSALALEPVTTWTCMPLLGPAYGPGMTVADCRSSRR